MKLLPFLVLYIIHNKKPCSTENISFTDETTDRYNCKHLIMAHLTIYGQNNY